MIWGVARPRPRSAKNTRLNVEGFHRVAIANLRRPYGKVLCFLSFICLLVFLPSSCPARCLGLQNRAAPVPPLHLVRCARPHFFFPLRCREGRQVTPPAWSCSGTLC